MATLSRVISSPECVSFLRVSQLLLTCSYLYSSCGTLITDSSCRWFSLTSTSSFPVRSVNSDHQPTTPDYLLSSYYTASSLTTAVIGETLWDTSQVSHTYYSQSCLSILNQRRSWGNLQLPFPSWNLKQIKILRVLRRLLLIPRKKNSFPLLLLQDPLQRLRRTQKL